MYQRLQIVLHNHEYMNACKYIINKLGQQSETPIIYYISICNQISAAAFEHLFALVTYSNIPSGKFN